MNQECIACRYSAIVLAGGKSVRMGEDKAVMDWNGMTLLDHQIEKLHRLGIRDILISGHGTNRDDVRVVEDVYAGCGPLAGLHACLQKARNPACLVLSVDVPLIRISTLEALLRHHEAGSTAVTVLRCGENIEPLIGVYEAAASAKIERILAGGGRSVRRLFDAVDTACFPFTADMGELTNCNTPGELAAARASAMLL